MNRTSIEWCRTYRPDGSYEHGFTTNPVRFLPRIENFVAPKPLTVTMCQKVSPGCTHCYAESIVRRFWPKQAGKFPGYTAAGVASGQFLLSESELQKILHHRKPCRLFWGDMTDLFQESIPDEFLDRCFAVCALTPHITHIFLTKRAERMLAYFNAVETAESMPAADRVAGLLHDEYGWSDSRAYALKWPLPNVWLGVSVEDQDQANKRIPLLLDTPAAVRFISGEPLLEDLNLNRIEVTDGEIDRSDPENPTVSGYCIDALTGEAFDDENGSLSTGPDGEVPLERSLDWVIVGGESGRPARKCHLDWLRSIVEQCKTAHVPCFVKQLGSLPVERTNTPGFTDKLVKLSSSKGGDWNEWPADLRAREFPTPRDTVRDYSGSSYLSTITEDACL